MDITNTLCETHHQICRNSLRQCQWFWIACCVDTTGYWLCV